MTTKSLHFSWGETQSCMSVRQPNALKLDYTRTMMGFLLFISEPTNIAMVGLGGGSLAKFCHHHLQRSHVHVIEVNPHVIALRNEFLVPPDGDRSCIVCGDGAEFVRLTPRFFDVLLVDGYDHRGLPESLSSQKFYDDCFERLTTGGILVANLDVNQEHYPDQVGRIRRSFSDAVLVVEVDEHSSGVVFASKGPLLPLLRGGAMHRPHQLDDTAWKALRHSFARILSSLAKQRS